MQELDELAIKVVRAEEKYRQFKIRRTAINCDIETAYARLLVAKSNLKRCQEG